MRDAMLPLLLATVVGCLSYGEFLDRKTAKWCEELAKCNPNTPCEGPVDTGYTDEDCNFDAKAARQCLNGLWVCDDRFVGFEYPVGPQACEAVCGAIE